MSLGDNKTTSSTQSAQLSEKHNSNITATIIPKRNKKSGSFSCGVSSTLSKDIVLRKGFLFIIDLNYHAKIC